MPLNQKDYQVMPEKPSMQFGFTLMELMVTLSIAGIMLSIAIPSFTSTEIFRVVVASTVKS